MQLFRPRFCETVAVTADGVLAAAPEDSGLLSSGLGQSPEESADGGTVLLTAPHGNHVLLVNTHVRPQSTQQTFREPAAQRNL